MPHIICEPCVGVRDTSCVGACPVDCISEAQATPHPPRGDEMLTIHPEESIDCGACVGACPVDAIFADDEVPDEWQEFIALNAAAFDI